VAAMRHREHSGRRHTGGRVDAIALDVFAVGWLARGMWRLRQGRLPWQGRRPRRSPR